MSVIRPNRTVFLAASNLAQWFRSFLVQRIQHVLCLDRRWVLFVCFGLASEFCWAQENQVTPDAPQKAEATEQSDTSNDSKIESHSVSKLALEKRKKATAGIAAVGAIAILGVGAIAMTMVWARRLRRFARDMGPQQTTEGNDFWFLKPPKPLVSDKIISEGHRPMHQPPPPDPSEAGE